MFVTAMSSDTPFPWGHPHFLTGLSPVRQSNHAHSFECVRKIVNNVLQGQYHLGKVGGAATVIL